MPADFEKCQRDGGRIRTIKPREDVYLYVCWDSQGKSHAGEVHHKGEGRNRIDSPRKVTPVPRSPLLRTTHQIPHRARSALKIRVGPKGGKYIIKNGKKQYIKAL